MSRFADRIKETSTSTGTGTINLAGAKTGFRTFVAGIGTGNQCYYTIVAIDSGGMPTGDWEVGIGTVTSGTPDTLSRSTVLSSSNSGSLVSFAAGTKDVFVVIPTNKFAGIDTNGTTNTLPMWTDGAGGIIGDSIISQDIGASNCYVGTPANSIIRLYIGAGLSSAVTAGVGVGVYGTQGSGTNGQGANLQLVAGRSTGNATPGTIDFFTSTVGGSGSSLQPAFSRWRIDGTGLLTALDATYIFTANNILPILGTAFQVGGLSRLTDAVPAATRFQAESAYSQATTNTGGATLHLLGGTGRRRYLVSDNTLGVVTVTTVVDGSSVALVSGTDFTLGTDNTAPQLAVTATNLAAAINANGTLNGKLAAVASADKVFLDKLTTTRTIALKSSNTSAIVPTQSTDGGIRNGSQPFNGISITAYDFGEVNQTDNVFINATKATGSSGIGATHQTLIGAGTGVGGFGGAFNTVIGYQGGININNAPENTIVGANAGNDITTGQQNVVLGRNAGFHMTTAKQNVVVGWQAGFTSLGEGQTAVKKILIGAGDLSDGGPSVLAGGDKSIGIGYGVVSGVDTSTGGPGTESQAYGYLASCTAANQWVVGGSNLNGDLSATGINAAYFGQGVTSTSPGAMAINATGGSGSNNAGASLAIAGGKSTGNANGGSVILKTSPPAASGSSLNALVTGFTLDTYQIGIFTSAVPTERVQPATTLTMPANYSLTVPDYYEISESGVLEIPTTGLVEITEAHGFLSLYPGPARFQGDNKILNEQEWFSTGDYYEIDEPSTLSIAASALMEITEPHQARNFDIS